MAEEAVRIPAGILVFSRLQWTWWIQATNRRCPEVANSLLINYQRGVDLVIALEPTKFIKQGQVMADHSNFTNWMALHKK